MAQHLTLTDYMRKVQNELPQDQAERPTSSPPSGTIRRSSSPPVERLEDAMPRREHFKKNGKIDRRFKGFRDLPEEPETDRNSAALVAPDGTRLTKSGKPDARFVENRNKSAQQILREWAKNIANATDIQ